MKKKYDDTNPYEAIAEVEAEVESKSKKVEPEVMTQPNTSKEACNCKGCPECGICLKYVEGHACIPKEPKQDLGEKCGVNNCQWIYTNGVNDCPKHPPKESVFSKEDIEKAIIESNKEQKKMYDEAPKQSNWEEEFYENFQINKDVICPNDPYTTKKIKDFIHNLLASEKEKWHKNFRNLELFSSEEVEEVRKDLKSAFIQDLKEAIGAEKDYPATDAIGRKIHKDIQREVSMYINGSNQKRQEIISFLRSKGYEI